MPHADDRPVVVVGAGASGLAAAAVLADAGCDVLCLEARNRPGGRLLSIRADSTRPDSTGTTQPGSTHPDGTGAGGEDALDLGATWFWDGEQRVQDLVARLGLDTFAQHTAGSAIFQDAKGTHRLQGNPIDGPAHRYTAGADALTDGLAATLPAGALRLNTPVTAIRATTGGLAVQTADTTHVAGHVVLAVPPALALARIDFGDALPTDLVGLARATPVWMGAVVKVIAVYPDAFWRHDGLAGAAFSYTGPLQELHDMSGPLGHPAALFGFGTATATTTSTGPAFRQAVIEQLTELFGPAAARPSALHVHDWSTEHWTSPPDVHRLNNYSLFGHPRYRQPALDGRLHWASTETTDYTGHLEGALAGGQRAARTVLSARSSPDPAPTTPR
ncbi:FAD-dependent oxidoreductase [Actinosynnema sp. NPDC050801]|uniref:flavin monoamine oxidase family protein n=1 Tax=unclassified Actinosynnema TaxID=2637065 RepID=UPI0033F7DE12